MKILKRKRGLIAFYLLLCVCFIGNEPILAQTTPSKRILLSDALKQITAHFKVNFLYEEIHVGNKKINFSADSLKTQKVERVLTALLIQVELRWSRIDQKNYAIFPVGDKKHNPKAEIQSGPILDTAGRADSKTDTLFNQAAPNLLKEVSITTNKAVVETRADRLVYNVGNSAMAAGNSIELLKTAPFVKVSAENAISLQGKNTMVLIDNKPVPESSLLNILQSLPAGNISKIELITQPSAKYDGTYGAVINIVTKKSKIEGFTGNIRTDASTGKYGAVALNSSLAYKYKALTLFGTAGLIRQDNLFSVHEERSIGLTNQTEFLTNNWKRLLHVSAYSFRAGADLELGKGQTIGFVADGDTGNAKGSWPTENAFMKSGTAAVDSVLFTEGTFRMPRYSCNFNLNYHLLTDSGKNELTVLATYTPARRNLQQYFPSVLKNGAGEILSTPPDYQTTNISDIKVYIGQLDFVHSFNRKWKLETGLKYQQADSRNEIDYLENRNGQFVRVPIYSSDNNLKESIAGAYGILLKDWKSDELQIGIRAEETNAEFFSVFKQHYFNLFPTVSYQHNIKDDQSFVFSYKRTISRVRYSELLPYAVFLNRYTVEQGNPALKPSYDNIFSISATLHKVNLSVSYTSTSGMIALFPVKEDPDTKLTYFSRQNLDRAYDYSVNLYFPLQINSWWQTQNSGTIIGYNKTEGRVLNAVYSLSAFHSDFKSAHIFQFSKGLKFEIDAYYWTGYVQDLTHFSGYKNLNASILIELFSGKGQLQIGGSELIFKRNDYASDRTFGSYRIHNVTNSDSRRGNIGFTYKFGKTSVRSPRKQLGNEDAMKRL
jgi:iron complex outermembrane receptor protein